MEAGFKGELVCVVDAPTSVTMKFFVPMQNLGESGCPAERFPSMADGFRSRSGDCLPYHGAYEGSALLHPFLLEEITMCVVCPRDRDGDLLVIIELNFI